MAIKAKPGIVIAIDGHASSGKSTLARRLAETLGYRYVDTGAMYRAVALYFREHNTDLNNDQMVREAMQNIHIRFKNENGRNVIYLNDQNVDEAIRSMDISGMVSDVARIRHVREVVVAQQQAMGRNKRVIMDGRDIGTVVFPEAELKIFLTADEQERTQRRYLEMRSQGFETSFEEVHENLIRRDHTDSTRQESPLRCADDAVTIDSTMLNRDEIYEKVLSLAYEAIEKQAAAST